MRDLREQIAGWLRANYEEAPRLWASWLDDAEQLMEIIEDVRNDSSDDPSAKGDTTP